MSSVTCFRCGQDLPVRDGIAAQVVECPHCGQVVGIAAPVATAAPAEPLAPSEQETLPPPLLPASGFDTNNPDPPSWEPATESLDFLAPAQEPGELGRLGSYRVLRVLGSGGMGVVLQAEDIHLKRLAALKVVRPGLSTSQATRQRFLREAQLAAAIKHDHIVTIYQVGQDRDIPFLAMEFLEGQSLDQRLRLEGKLPVPEALRIAREIAEGLAAAHESGLIHRDIKPANIWLEGERGRVKILDFGLARAVSGDARLTQSGAVLGTPLFMAPEQARNLRVDGRCDLFSLGCVLYRACTGQLPFQGTDTISTLMAVATDQPPLPRSLNPEIPPRLAGLIMNLLAKDPAARPSTARAVIGVLAAIEKQPASSVVLLEVIPLEEPGDTVPRTATGSRIRPPRPAPAIPPLTRTPPSVRQHEQAVIRGAGILAAIGGAVIGLVLGAVLGKEADGVLWLGILGVLVGILAGRFLAGLYIGFVTARGEGRSRGEGRGTREKAKDH